MNMRVWKIVGLLAALALVFVIGAAAGGGIVFAASQAFNSPGHQALAPVQEDEEPGVVIASLDPDGPAAQAGVRRGDILLKIDEQAVNHPQDLIDTLREREPGDPVELSLLHGDEERTLTAVLAEREAGPYLGLTPCFGLPSERAMIRLHMAGPGARVIQVLPDSPADEAGLQVGDLITSVDGQALDAETDLADLIAQHAPGDSITLEVQSPGQEARQVSLELGEHPEKAGAAYLGVQYLPAPDIEQFDGMPLPFGGPRFREMRPFDDDFLFVFPEGDFEGGALVGRVADDSPAATAGLRRGDIITALEGQPVDSPEAIVDAVAERQPGDVLKLSVYRPEADDTLELEVTLAEHPEAEGKAYLGVTLAGAFFGRGVEGDSGPGPLLPGQPGRRFEFRLPVRPDRLPFDLDLDFDAAPRWFHFETPPDDNCCGSEFSSET